MYDELNEFADKDEAKMAIIVMLLALVSLAYLMFEIFQKDWSVKPAPVVEEKQSTGSQEDRYNIISSGFSGE